MLQGMDSMDLNATWDDMERRYPGSYRISTNIIDTTGGRFGGGTFRGNNTSAYMRLPFTGSPDTVVFAAALKAIGSITYDHNLLFCYNPAGAWNWYCQLIAGGYVRVRGPGGILGDSSIPVAVTTGWRYFELKVYAHDTLGTVDMLVDGNSVLSLTNQDTKNGAGGVSHFMYYPNDSQGWWVDDWLWLDDTGTYNNDLLGDKRLEVLRPSGDASVQFTRSGGSNNFEMVDDSPDSDDDATYNESGVVGYTDRFDLPSLSVTPDEISAVQAVVVSRKTGAGAASQKFGVYSGTTEGLSAAAGVATDYEMSMHIEEDNPDDSLAWEEADITALQLQYEHA